MDTQVRIDLAQSDPNFATELDGSPIPEDWYLHERYGGDYERYKDIIRDSHFTSRVRTRIQSVLSRGVRVYPASRRQTDVMAARGIANILGLVNEDTTNDGSLYFSESFDFAEHPSKTAYIPYESVSQKLLWGLVFGHSDVKYDWSIQSNLLIPTDFQVIDRNRIRFAYHAPEDDTRFITGENLSPDDIALAEGYEIRILTKQNWTEGDRIPKGRVIHFDFGSPDGRPWGIGLAFQCYPWHLVKRQDLKAWLLFADRLGGPPVQGEIEGDLNLKNAEEMAAYTKFVRFLRSISPNSWFVGSRKFKTTILETTKGSSDIHDRLLKVADEQMSEIILGDRSYAEKESGSRAANESQVDDRNLTITDADCNLLDEALQHYLWNDVSRLNYPQANPPLVRRETFAERIEREEQAKAQQRKEESRKRRIDGDRTLYVDMRMRPTPDYIETNYPGWELTVMPTPTEIEMEEARDFAGASRYVYWHGFKIGIEYEVGSERFGRPMKVAYGYVTRHRGEDGEALDVYLGSHLSSDSIFRVYQNRVDTSHDRLRVVMDESGTPILDEYKYMIFFETSKQAEKAFKRQMPSVFFGGIEEVNIDDILNQNIDFSEPVNEHDFLEPVELDDHDDGLLDDEEFNELIDFERAANAWRRIAPDDYATLLDSK